MFGSSKTLAHAEDRKSDPTRSSPGWGTLGHVTESSGGEAAGFRRGIVPGLRQCPRDLVFRNFSSLLLGCFCFQISSRSP